MRHHPGSQTSPVAGRCVFSAAIILVLILSAAIAASDVTDLSGWWRAQGDSTGYVFVRIYQQGVDVSITVYDGDGTFTVAGVVSNDTVLVFQGSDTLAFVYADDTLHGFNEVGEPITLIRFTVDLNGWWKFPEGEDILSIRGTSTSLTIWMEMESVCVADGTFADDTLLLYLRPPLTGTLILVYVADTLRGLDPWGDPMILVRAPYGQWIPVRCATIDFDGGANDWSEAHLVADDFDDDGLSTPAAELDKLYLCHDSTYLYFRIECVGEVAFPHSGGYGDGYSLLLGPNGNDYGIAIGDIWAIRFRNNVTGEEMLLEAPHIHGHVIEGRIPLDLVDGLVGKIRISASSAYYDWDSGYWSAYDEIKFAAELQACGARTSCVSPQPQRVIWANTIYPFTDTLIIGNLADRAASEIVPASMLINHAIQPASAELVLEYPGFAGGVLKLLFPARPFLHGYMPVWDTTVVSYTVSGKYWDGLQFQDSGNVTLIGHRLGDVNLDGAVNVADLTYLISNLFMGGPEPPLKETADIDRDGAVTVADVTVLVRLLFGR